MAEGLAEGGIASVRLRAVLDSHDPRAHWTELRLAVGAPGRPLGQVLRTQLKANPANAPVLAEAIAAIDRLEAGRSVDVTAMHPALSAFMNASMVASVPP